jgi:uncharacterized protein YegL
MAKDKGLIVVVLDRSGSMASIKDDMQGGLNKFIDDQKKAKGEVKFTLAQFDNQYEVLADLIDIQDAKPYSLEPRGSTALLDAIGKTVTTVRGQVQALDKKDRPKKTVVCIITDGMENASAEWKHGDVMALIKECEKDGWEFAYLGANQDAIAVGGSVGIRAASSMDYATNPVAMAATFDSMSNNTTAYLAGTTDTVEFTEEQRKKSKSS